MDSEYRPDIDGLRALAVLAVLGFHSVPTVVSGGFVGVDVFFVISGYLISGNVSRALRGGEFSYLEFYVRRIKRIFPALLVLLVTTLGLGWMILLYDEFSDLGMQTVAGASFVINETFYRHSRVYFGGPLTPLVHLWSLAVEEQFYLVWPLFLVAMWNLKSYRLFVLAAVIITSFSLNVIRVHIDPTAAFYLTTSRLWELAAGSMLAYIEIAGVGATHTLAPRVPWCLFPSRLVTASTQGIVGGALIVTSIVMLDHTDAFPGFWATLPVVGALMVISAGAHSWLNRHVLSRREWVYVGLISYPLYLWHWPLLSYARLIACEEHAALWVTAALAFAFILAALTYKYIELPIRCASSTVQLSGTLLATMVVLGVLGYEVLCKRIPARPESVEVERFIERSREPFPPFRDEEKWISTDSFLRLGDPNRYVLLIGDSNIYQYYSRVARLLEENSSHPLGAVFAARALCALAGNDIEDGPDLKPLGSSREECKAYLQKAVSYAKGPGVGAVVIGAGWYGYFIRDRNSNNFGEPGPLQPDVDRALDGLKKTISDLVFAGKRVYLVLQVPVGRRVAPRGLIRRSIVSPGFAVDTTPPTRMKMWRVIGAIDEKLRKVAVDSGARVIDPMETLCDLKECLIVTPSGGPMYRDAAHLLPSYVRDNVRFLDEVFDHVEPDGAHKVLLRRSAY